MEFNLKIHSLVLFSWHKEQYFALPGLNVIVSSICFQIQILIFQHLCSKINPFFEFSLETVIFYKAILESIFE